MPKHTTYFSNVTKDLNFLTVFFRIEPPVYDIAIGKIKFAFLIAHPKAIHLVEIIGAIQHKKIHNSQAQEKPEGIGIFHSLAGDILLCDPSGLEEHYCKG